MLHPSLWDREFLFLFCLILKKMFINIFFLVVILSSDSCFSLNCDTRPLPSNMSSYKVHSSLSFFIGGYLNGPTCIAHSWLIVIIIFGIICDLFFSALIYNIVPVLVLCGPTIFYSLCFSIFICNLGVDGLLQSYWIVCQYWWNIVSDSGLACGHDILNQIHDFVKLLYM